MPAPSETCADCVAWHWAVRYVARLVVEMIPGAVSFLLFFSFSVVCHVTFQGTCRHTEHETLFLAQDSLPVAWFAL